MDKRTIRKSRCLRRPRRDTACRVRATVVFPVAPLFLPDNAFDVGRQGGFTIRWRFYNTTAVRADTAVLQYDGGSGGHGTPCPLRVGNTTPLPLHTTPNLFYIPSFSDFSSIACLPTPHRRFHFVIASRVFPHRRFHFVIASRAFPHRRFRSVFQIDKEPSRKSLSARWTLMQTGMPDAASRLASSSVASIWLLSVSKSPFPPYPSATRW